jgi:hypothetical protein
MSGAIDIHERDKVDAAALTDLIRSAERGGREFLPPRLIRTIN